jgi:ArsR family transcriptional regulator, arsenate/arsenite/antimonite-responsive transcriptional repressor
VVTPHLGQRRRESAVRPLGTGTDQAVAVLAALGHRLRLELWRTLLPHGSRGLPAGSLAARLAVAPSSLSFHLHQMKQAGILVRRRSSRQIIYAVNSEAVERLCNFLANHTVGNEIRLPTDVLSLEPRDDLTC